MRWHEPHPPTRNKIDVAEIAGASRGGRADRDSIGESARSKFRHLRGDVCCPLSILQTERPDSQDAAIASRSGERWIGGRHVLERGDDPIEGTLESRRFRFGACRAYLRFLSIRSSISGVPRRRSASFRRPPRCTRKPEAMSLNREGDMQAPCGCRRKPADPPSYLPARHILAPAKARVRPDRREGLRRKPRRPRPSQCPV